MTFAEGEWVKEIRITVPEDEEPEALKFGTFTIVDNDGASLYDTANTLTLRVSDNDKAEASTLGFAVTQVRADKAAGTAELTVVRTGGNQTMVTIDYATVDGTAVAGTDYAATSGTLVFYADRNQQVIEVPLIDDGVATEEERTFQVVLSNLKGDGEGLCTLEGTRPWCPSTTAARVPGSRTWPATSTRATSPTCPAQSRRRRAPWPLWAAARSPASRWKTRARC